MRTTTPTARLSTNKPLRTVSGVFTKKKIDDWVEYLTQGFGISKRIDAENERKIIGYRNRLEALSDVVWVHDKKVTARSFVTA